MSASEPSLPAHATVSEAVLSTKLQGLARDLGEVKGDITDLARLATEMRIFMAESRAVATQRDKADTELHGRIGKMETRVDALEGFRWRILAAIAASGALGGGLSELLGLVAG